MTRGKVILIQGDMQVYITCEFNGDMHPNMHGEEVLECFKNGLFRNSRENIENDFCNEAALQISHESTVVFLLKKMLHDKYDYIDYFIYELDYGRKYEAGMITDESGQDIDIRIHIHTPDLLYDFISNNGVICQKEV